MSVYLCLPPPDGALGDLGALGLVRVCVFDEPEDFCERDGVVTVCCAAGCADLALLLCGALFTVPVVRGVLFAAAGADCLFEFPLEDRTG
jgi:hypothetical protein